MLTPSSTDLESSQGLVVYSIMENAALPIGSEIENTAYIYFDFNPPIVTNTTYNVNASGLGLDENSGNTIALFPNPVNTTIHFKGGNVNSIKIIDIAGKIVLNSNSIIQNAIQIDSLSDGLYSVIVETDNGFSNHKISILK